MQYEIHFIARYAETDQMGIIHHSNYPIWFEAGRTDFLKKAGLPNSNIEAWVYFYLFLIWNAALKNRRDTRMKSLYEQKLK